MLDTIAAMLKRGSLVTQANRTKALEIATQAIRSDDWESIAGVISIVAASCDDDLQRHVMEITFGPRRLPGIEPSQREGLRYRGERALQQCLDKRSTKP